MTTPTIGSDNTQTDERKEMLADILKLREALQHYSRLPYGGDAKAKQALNETQKWEKGK